LLDKHSEDYDPDAFTAMVDDERKRLKESASPVERLRRLPSLRPSGPTGVCGKPSGSGEPWFNLPCCLPENHKGPCRAR
jgi:hypothetical protein